MHDERWRLRFSEPFGDIDIVHDGDIPAAISKRWFFVATR
jgi:hypothetical protein